MKDYIVPESKKFCVTHDENGDLETVYIIRFVRDDVLGLEAIDCGDILYLTNINSFPDDVPSRIVTKNFFEIERSKLHDPKFYYTWVAVLAELSRDIRKNGPIF